MSISDCEPPKEKTPTDWSGTIIGAALLPLFFLFIYIGKAELGFTTCIVLAMVMVAVKVQWNLRRHLWFWATIILILALHIPLLFIVQWPQSNVPTLAYSLPLGIVDFFVITAAINLAERVFADEED